MSKNKLQKVIYREINNQLHNYKKNKNHKKFNKIILLIQKNKFKFKKKILIQHLKWKLKNNLQQTQFKLIKTKRRLK